MKTLLLIFFKYNVFFIIINNYELLVFNIPILIK